MWWKFWRLFLNLFSIQLQWTWSDAFKPQKQQNNQEHSLYDAWAYFKSSEVIWQLCVRKRLKWVQKKAHERTFWIFSMNHLIRFIKPMILLNWTDLVLQFNSLIHSFTAVSNKTLLVLNLIFHSLCFSHKATEVVYEQL